MEETFILFNDPDGAVPDRVAHSVWLSLCRDAIVAGKRVQVTTANENSAQVTTVTLLPT